jgi:hypothetical protein
MFTGHEPLSLSTLQHLLFCEQPGALIIDSIGNSRKSPCLPIRMIIKEERVRAMHIIIGDTPFIGRPPKREGGGKKMTNTEARVLAVRAPRRRRRPVGLSEGKERRSRQSPDCDPANGKVLVLLAPGDHLPADLESGNYRVFVKIVPR